MCVLYALVSHGTSPFFSFVWYRDQSNSFQLACICHHPSILHTKRYCCLLSFGMSPIHNVVMVWVLCCMPRPRCCCCCFSLHIIPITGCKRNDERVGGGLAVQWLSFIIWLWMASNIIIPIPQHHSCSIIFQSLVPSAVLSVSCLSWMCCHHVIGPKPRCCLVAL